MQDRERSATQLDEIDASRLEANGHFARLVSVEAALGEVGAVDLDREDEALIGHLRLDGLDDLKDDARPVVE
jgi:hypothetical protein